MKERFYELLNLRIEPQEVRVRSYCNILISFSLNMDLPQNSFLIFRLRGGRNNKNDWYCLQPYDPNEKGYAKLKLSSIFQLIPCLLTGKDLAIKYLVCEEKGIKKGTIFNFNVSKTLVQSLVEENKKIEVLIELPNKNPIIIKNSPTIDVLYDLFDHITLICPSIVIKNENFSILIRIEDKYHNLVKNFVGLIELFKLIDPKEKENLCEIRFDNNYEGFFKLDNLKFSEKGIYRIGGIYNNKAFKSNPIICYEKSIEKKLYWGYIHGHSNKSDGILSPELYFKNLVKAGLNFGTITEHDHAWETSNKDFDEIKEIVNKYHKDGEFVSFFGYEWGYWYTGGFGDICIYYNDNNIPILRSDTNKYNSTEKLIKNLLPYNDKVLLIAHHTALRPGFRNWKYFNNSLEKLVEIYSTWGNQEYSFKEGNPLPVRYKFFGYGKYAKKHGPILEKKVGFIQEALRRGYKLGFVAGGDDHFGIYPSGPMNPDNGIYPSGIMAIWAEKLTKKSIWEALTSRHCYGTTGPRVIVEFNINRFIMGDIINLEKNLEFINKRRIFSTIVSPIEILKIELIRNNNIIKLEPVNSEKFKFEYIDNEGFEEISLNNSQNTKERFIFYYLRIFLLDNNMAWSSPIWVIKNV